MSDSDINNMWLANGAAIQARSETAAANQRTHEAEQRMWRERMKNLTEDSPDVELKKRVQTLGAEKNLAEYAFKTLKQSSDAALAEKDAIILEWQHACEAFRQLSWQYGVKLGLTAEQRTENYHRKILDVAEKDPEYANTKIGKEIRADLNKKTAKP